MKKFSCSGGFSLVEIVIASAFLAMIVLGVVRVFHSHVTLVKKNVYLTRATTLSEEISSKLKSQPFDSIFSYDSDIQHPPKPVCCTGAFKPDAYLIDIDESPIKPVLTDFLAKVKVAGFDRFRIDVSYMRRDSTPIPEFESFTDKFVPWAFIVSGLPPGDILPAVSPGIAGGCSPVDPNLCFQDINSDKDYWDVVDGKPETPFTGLKLVTVTVYKSGEPVGVKQGNIMSKWGLSGQEVGSGQSPLKLKLTYPKAGSWAFQLAPHTKKALELRTRRAYPSSMFSKNTGVVRIDETDEGVHMNRQCDLNGIPIGSSDPIFFGSENRYLRVAGFTDESQSGYLRIYDQLNSSVNPGNVFHESKLFSPAGTAFDTPQFGGAQFEILSGSGFLMRDGVHRLWSRKQDATQDTDFSPFDVRLFNVDNGVPKMTINYISEYEWPYGGRTPLVQIAISDYFQGNGVSASKYSGVSKQVTWAAVVPVDPVGVTTQTWPSNSGGPNPPSAWRMYFSVSGATATVNLRDKDYYPWKLNYDTEYKIIWEWGDNVGYKSSTTYSFKIPDNSSTDATPPVIQVNTSLVTTIAPIILRPLTSMSPPTPVQQGVIHSLIPLWFRDDQSGIDFKTLKIEICPDALPGPMNLAGQTPGCRTLLHHEYENKKPDSSLFGQLISYSSKSSRSSVRTAFTSPGTGVLAGLDFTVGSVWQIRASVQNWAGLVTITPDDYWRFVIVAP